MKKIAVFVVGAAMLNCFQPVASSAAVDSAITKTLSSVPAGDLPLKCTQLVKTSPKAQRSHSTSDIVKAAAGVNPAATPSVVGAIAKAFPDVSAPAAAAALSEQPKQLVAIARAAAANARSMAPQIALAMCKVAPKQAQKIIAAVSDAAPGKSKEIIEVVGNGIPELKPELEKAFAAGADGNEASSKGPTIGPPYIPYPGSPANLNPGTSGEVPTGGRDYAKP